MRRIIERVVTVVTTTTWKISWEADIAPVDDSTRTDLNTQEVEEMDVDWTEKEKTG
jgi:hypothetical protein